jgi:hypothetical protein
MFARSAASDTLQGRAMQAVNEKWGEDYLQRAGRESIAGPVCKKKYAPFIFSSVRQKNGRFEVQVERTFACKCHHPIRQAVIEQHGLRDGWEPYGQWSLQKAKEMARRQTMKLNGETASDGETSAADDSSLSSSNGSLSFCLSGGSCPVKESAPIKTRLTDICLNGNCTWKVKSAYDDIYHEIHGHTESEAEEEC